MNRQQDKGVTGLVLKTMGMFGGVQSLSIICSVVRMKLVALWIGAAGVGLFSIFNSAQELISMITQLGIRNSAVRDLASSKGDKNKLQITITVVRRWGWLLGIFGAFLMLVTAPIFSKQTFGDYSHTWQFALVSVSVFLTSITASEGAILQGAEKLKPLAIASLWGAMSGLVISIPLFYFLGINSILPSIIVYSLATSLALIFHRVRRKPDAPKVTYRETLRLGRGFMELGLYMTISGFVGQLFNYIFIAFLTKTDGASVVGLYQAGFTLTNKYVGLVFAAIAMEYYPRLTSVADSRRRSSVFVSHEMSLIMLILLPLTTLFIPAAQLAIKILYSQAFIPCLPFVVISMLGIVFKGVSWCMSFLILARGDGRTYVWTECLSEAVNLVLGIWAYLRWGLMGLGISYTLGFAAFIIIVGIPYLRYKLTISRKTILTVVITVAVVTAQVVLYFFTPVWVLFTVAILATTFSAICLIKMLA